MRHLLVLVIPAAACLVVVVASSGVQRRLAPATGAVLLTGAALTAAAAVVLSLATVGLAYVAQVPQIASLVGWCQSVVAVDDHVPSAIGIAATVGMAVATWRGIRFLRRSTWRCDKGSPSVIVVESLEVEAVAMPGRPNQIVVSTAMIDLLDEPEREAMFAHERAHIEHRHHRFLVLAGAASAAVPLVAPIAARVRYCTERWADEAAAEQTGDREVVARAITRAALAGTNARTSPPLALTGIGVAGRVAALRGPRPAPSTTAFVLFAVGVIGLGVSIGASTLQLHHLVGFLEHVCGIT